MARLEATSRPHAHSTSRALRSGLLVAALLAAAACSPRAAPPADPAPERVVVDRLWFGRAVPGGGEVTEEEWREFVKDVVSPRFPAGLTIWRGEGQWLDPRGDLIREPVMVLELFHGMDPATDQAIREIAEEYKRRFRQDAVLHVRGAGEMRFYD